MVSHLLIALLDTVYDVMRMAQKFIKTSLSVKALH